MGGTRTGRPSLKGELTSRLFLSLLLCLFSCVLPPAFAVSSFAVGHVQPADDFWMLTISSIAHLQLL